MRFDPKKLTADNQKRLLSEFYKAATLIEDYNEAKAFFRGILTLKERIMLARRLQVAVMLIEGFTYGEIIDTLKVGKSTVANVRKWLSSGGQRYKTIIERLLKYERAAAQKKEKLKDPLSLERLKKKYSSYYWSEKALEEVDKFLKKRAKRKSLPKE